MIVRPVGGYGMPDHLRVTIGLPQENERFLAALAAALRFVIERLVVVGVGLIGGSFAPRCARPARCAAWSASAARRRRWRGRKEIGLIDEAHDDAAAALRGADLVHARHARGRRPARRWSASRRTSVRRPSSPMPAAPSPT